MEDGAGEDLGWFWKAWFYETWKFDQSVKSVQYINQDPANGALITIENMEKMALPTEVEIEAVGEEKIRLKFPVEIWQRGSTWEFRVNTKHPIKSVSIDPDHVLPDVNSKNNVWRPMVFREPQRN